MSSTPDPHGARSRHLKGISITAFGVLILTPDGLLTSLVAADVRTALFWRGLFMALALTAFVLLRYRRNVGKTIRALLTGPQVFVALMFAVSSIGFVVSVVTTSVANTLFIVASAPLFSALLGWIALGERTPPRTIIAILIAMTGMAVIFAEGLGRGDLWGNVAALITALAWACMVVVLSHAKIKDPAPALALGGYMIAGAAFLVAPTIAVVTLDLVWLAILGLFVLPVSFFLIGLGPQYIPPPEVSLIMLLEAVLGPIWAWFFIAQSPSPQTMLGGALILVTLAIHFAIGLVREQQQGS
jgi:drug/metabolite transporter (DMT)-like permease